MPSSFRSVIVISAVALGMVLGCQQEGQQADVNRTADGTLRLGTVEAVDTLMRAVAPSSRPLIIDGFRGAIALAGTDGTTADLAFIRRGRGRDTDAARDALDGITVAESGSQEAYTYTLAADGAAYAAVDVRGTVPQETDLRVDQTSGPITIENVGGAITVEHEHGPITIRGAAAPVEVTARNGDLSLDFQAVPSEATVRLETANGDVTLGLPPEAAARIDAQTNAGAIRTTGLTLTDEQFTPIDGGGRYTATLGTGAADIEVRTNNGTIRLQAADTTRTASAPDTMAIPPSDTTVVSQTPSDTMAPEESALPSDTTSPPSSGRDTAASDTSRR